MKKRAFLCIITIIVACNTFSQSQKDVFKIIKSCIEYDSSFFIGARLNHKITPFQQYAFFTVKDFDKAQKNYTYKFKEALFSESDYECFQKQITDNFEKSIAIKKIKNYTNSRHDQQQRIISFTQPLFYCDGQKAIISYYYICPFKCGAGSTLLLIKAKGKWIVKDEIWSFIS